MVTPIGADLNTLRWCAEYIAAQARDEERYAQLSADGSDRGLAEAARWRDRAFQKRQLANSLRVRASRIEGKQKRARGRR
jgi:hypothetical protein